MSSIKRDKKVVGKEMQPDAQWKKIQEKTFTRWVNQKLSSVNMSADNLAIDFEDGLKLIRLVEVLSGKLLGKRNKKVSFRSQRLENVSLALNFLENEEHLKIINIDSCAIVDRNMKLILGLVWTLIVHYSISKQMWSFEKCEEDAEVDSGRMKESEVNHLSPREKLMIWIKSKLPSDLTFSNFTSDWNNGLLLAALVSALGPELRMDWREWNEESALERTRLVMRFAEKHMDVAQLIRAEELLNEEIDEKSVMTYLAQFPRATYKPALGYVDHLHSNAAVGVMSEFVVNVSRESMSVAVVINGPDNKPISDVSVSMITPLQYSVRYSPSMKGVHEINVTIRDQGAGDSFELQKENVFASVEPRLIYDRMAFVGQTAAFTIEGAEEGSLAMSVTNPNGDASVLPLTQQSHSSYCAELTPHWKGEYLVHVLCCNKPIAGSPFVMECSYPAEFMSVWGRGIVKRGLRIGETARICLKIGESCKYAVDVRVVGCDGEIEVNKSFDERTMIWTYSYKIDREGDYEVSILYGDGRIEYSRDVVHADGPCANESVRAFGCGIEEGGIRGKRSDFFITHSVDDRQKIEYFVKDANGEYVEVMSDCELSNDSSVLRMLHFTPAEEGVHEVSVMYNGEHVNNSPLIVMVNRDDRAAQINRSSIAVDETLVNSHLTAFQPQQQINFRIDTSSVAEGMATPSVLILDSDFKEVPFDVIVESQSTLFLYQFIPNTVGRYLVFISIAGVQLQGSPFQVNVESDIDGWNRDMKKVVRVGQPINWLIHNVDQHPFELLITDLNDQPINQYPITIEYLPQNKTKIAFTVPQQTGIYKLKLFCDGKEVGCHRMDVQPQLDVSRFEIDLGEGEALKVGEQRSIRIDTKGMEALDGGLEVLLGGANGEEWRVEMVMDSDGVYMGEWNIENVGEFRLWVFFDGVLIRERTVVVGGGSEAIGTDHGQRVGEEGSAQSDDASAALKNTEDGTNGGDEHCEKQIVAKESESVEVIALSERRFEFTIGNESDLDKILVSVQTPSGLIHSLPISRIDANRVEVIYRPTEIGRHFVTMKYNDVHLEGSPFEFAVNSEHDAEQRQRANIVTCDDSLLMSDGAVAGVEHRFVISPNEDCVTEPEVVIEGDDGEQLQVSVSENESGSFIVEWMPPKAGEYKVNVKMDSEHAKGSPFTIVVDEHSKQTDQEHPQHSALAKNIARVCREVQSATQAHFTASLERSTDLVECHEPHSINPTHIGAEEAGDYEITFKENGSALDKEPIIFHADEEERESLAPNEQIEVKRRCDEQRAISSQKDVMKFASNDATPIEVRHFKFVVDDSTAANKLSAIVRTPSGEYRSALVQDNTNGEVRISYQPTEYGMHMISLRNEDVDMEGSTMEFDVMSVGDLLHRIRIEPDDLEWVVVGRESEFAIVNPDTLYPSAEICVSIGGIANVMTDVHQDYESGKYIVKWTPPVAGEYEIRVTVANQPISGSPFLVTATEDARDEGDQKKRSDAFIELPKEVILNVTLNSTDQSDLLCCVKSPSGVRERCHLRVIDSEHIGVFLPAFEVGVYEVRVTVNGTEIAQSPYSVNITEEDLEVDASGVFVVEEDLKRSVVVNECNEVLIDARAAGGGKVEMVIDGPAEAEVGCEDFTSDGIVRFCYRMIAAGHYEMMILINGEHIRGSPVSMECSAEERINVSDEVTVNVSEEELLAEEGQVSDKTFIVSKAKERLLFAERMVESMKKVAETGAASKVICSGEGIHKFVQNQFASFDVDCSNAESQINFLMVGAATESGPCEELITRHVGNGRYRVSYRIDRATEALIFVKYGGVNIPGSPFDVTSCDQ